MNKTSCINAKMAVGVLVCLSLAGQVANADFIFGEPTPLPAPLNSPSHDPAVTMSADGLQLYYAESDAIWVATRTSTADDWSSATHLQVVDPQLGQRGPVISADGLELYFSKGMPTDIYRARRQSLEDPWETAEKLGEPVSGSFWDSVASLSVDGLEMYISTSWEGVDRRVIRATKESEWVLPEVSEIIPDEAGISPSGLQLFFSSKDLPGGTGSTDLGMMTRPSIDADWSDPVNLEALTSTSMDRAPWIAYDGSVIFFVSLRPGGMGGADRWQAPIMPVVDFNGDDAVDELDALELLEHWGETDSPLYDIGPTPFGDGIIDAKDLRALADYMIEAELTNDVNDL